MRLRGYMPKGSMQQHLMAKAHGYSLRRAARLMEDAVEVLGPMERPAFPAVYAFMHRILVTVGTEHGYAMALHGSLATDLDVIAVPWTENAAPAEQLIEACIERLGAVDQNITNPGTNPGRKPHGRLAWSLLLSGHAYVDLSVMPRLTNTPGDPGRE